MNVYDLGAPTNRKTKTAKATIKLDTTSHFGTVPPSRTSNADTCGAGGRPRADA